jgi:hypothetical protein
MPFQEANALNKNVILTTESLRNNQKGSLLAIGCVSLNLILLILFLSFNLGNSYIGKNHLQKTALLASQAGGAAILDDLYEKSLESQKNSSDSQSPHQFSNLFSPEDQKKFAQNIEKRTYDEIIFEKAKENFPSLKGQDLIINYHLSRDKLRVEVTIQKETDPLFKKFTQSSNNKLKVTANTLITLPFSL